MRRDLSVQRNRLRIVGPLRQQLQRFSSRLLGTMLLWLLMTTAHSVEVASPRYVSVADLSSATFVYTGWLMSEKYDGVRAIWDGSQLKTRKGYRIDAPKWFTANLPPFACDGELWLGRAQFAEISAIARSGREHPEWEKVQYRVFEVPNQPGDLLQRLAVLNAYLSKNALAHVRVIPQTRIESLTHLHRYYQQVLERKGEGIIVRQGLASYQSGRLKTMFKLKPEQDAECRIIGYTEGQGPFAGQVGAIQCELLPDIQSRLFPALENHAQIKIGSGLTHALRQNPPQVGTVITFRYSGLTKYGKPRFPRFLRVRNEP